MGAIMNEKPEIVRLKAEHYDQLVELLNAVFSRKNGRQMDFERDLPKMFVRNDQKMGSHLVIFDGNRLVGVVGIYILPTIIAGVPLTFSTVGNIAVHWDYEGKGYMSLLVNRAMEELKYLNVDASRLGGLRQRYNRFGYETCGQLYNFIFTAHNNKRCFSHLENEKIEFSPIDRNDIETIKFCRELYQKGGISTVRSIEDNYADTYNTMLAWTNYPYLAKNQKGEPIGYLCVNENKNSIAEFFAISTQETISLISAWQRFTGLDISFRLPPYEVELIKHFSASCEAMNITPACHFKIMNYVKVVDALLKLKASYVKLPDGELNVKIKDYGCIKLSVKGSQVGCELTDELAQIEVDKLQAQRLLFGTFAPQYTADTGIIANAFLPLPLSWNYQDRV